MKSIVSYKDRGMYGDSKYRGNFSGRLLESLHKVYKFEQLSDYMRGSNTTGDFAEAHNIKASTYDLNMGFDLIDDDIRERNKNIIWHPPYWDIIKYSGFQYGKEPIKNDLSHIADYKEFIKGIDYCTAKQFASLETGGRMFILMADVKKNHVLYSMLLDMAKIGTIEQIVIKEQHNCWSDYKKYANENFIRIAHEYLLILRKDNPYLYNLKITKNVNFDVRDSIKTTWKDVVAAALESLGEKCTLNDIYGELEMHDKAKANIHWKEKIRQTLQMYKDIFINVDRGIWALR